MFRCAVVLATLCFSKTKCDPSNGKKTYIIETDETAPKWKNRSAETSSSYDNDSDGDGDDYISPIGSCNCKYKPGPGGCILIENVKKGFKCECAYLVREHCIIGSQHYSLCLRVLGIAKGAR